MSQVPPRKKQKREDYRKSLTGGDDVNASLPSKKFYRQRAHANPFADKDLSYPSCPEAMDWGALFPVFREKTHQEQQKSSEDDSLELQDGSLRIDKLRRQVEIADIGCGFGGLLFGLAPVFPETLIVGMELRMSVAEFVQEKIKAMRQQALRSQDTNIATSAASAAAAAKADAASVEATQGKAAGSYQNIACVRANTMKFMPNFFAKAQLRAVFLCFPDPHFKARKHKARIVSATLNTEYAYVLRPGGMVYTITDVEDLHGWMVEHFERHAGFARVPVDEMDEGSEEKTCVDIMTKDTEEGKKVGRNGGLKLIACFRRLEDPPWPAREREEKSTES